MKKSKIILSLSLIILALLIIVQPSCKTLKDITQSLTNLQRCQFKLQNVDNFRLMGISLSNKSSLNQFSLTDAANLVNAFSKNSFPAEFTLNVAAINPNDGTSGTTSTTATLTSFDWQLYIDDVPTISGNIAKPIEIPGRGQTTIIPLTMSLDLYKFFSNKGYEGIVNLALAIGGLNGSPARLKLDAKPTISTPLGAISYPGRITIIDKEFR